MVTDGEQILGSEISSDKVKMVLATIEGYKFGSDVDDFLFKKTNNTVKSEQAGVEIANVDRFGFQDEARKRIDELIKANPKLKSVELKYGGMTEVTVFFALELVKRGVDVTFLRFDSKAKTYRPYYKVMGVATEDVSRSSDNFTGDVLGTMPRHDFPDIVKNFLFDEVEPKVLVQDNEGTVQRDAIDEQVTHYFFDKDSGVSVEHRFGGKGVSIEWGSAPKLSKIKIDEYIKNNPQVDQVNLFYSGLTEVLVIAAFELAKAGKRVVLMGYDEQNKDYKSSLVINPMPELEREGVGWKI